VHRASGDTPGDLLRLDLRFRADGGLVSGKDLVVATKTRPATLTVSTSCPLAA
jgi:hypothetical protein